MTSVVPLRGTEPPLAVPEIRPLTPAEIETIVNGLRFSVKHTIVQESLINIHRQKTRAKLQTIKIRADKVGELTQEVWNSFYKSICSPYESIGVNASQCIGEPTTQGTLNTFHSSGISAKNTTLGFRRASELFNATHTPTNPMCTIYFTRGNSNPEQLHAVSDKIPMVTVDTVLKDWQVFDPVEYLADCEENPKKWQTAWWLLNPETPEINEDEWCLRLKFNVARLYNHNLTIMDICKRIKGTFSDIRCIPSPLNIGIIDVIIDCGQISLSSSQSPHLGNIPDESEARKFYVSKIVAPRIRGEYLAGVQGITKLYPRKIKSNELFGGFPLKPHIAESIKNHDEEWIVDTDGNNLSEVLALPFVDATRTISNDMWEIMAIFGIEAVRQYLFVEFMNIITSGGSTINPVHISTLVSKMTYTGNIRAIARFGVETAQYDPIARATFEEVMSQLITSTVFSEKDRLRGISSNIVLGTKISAGTGMVEFEDIQLTIVKKPQPPPAQPTRSQTVAAVRQPQKKYTVEDEYDPI